MGDKGIVFFGKRKIEVRKKKEVEIQDFRR